MRNRYEDLDTGVREELHSNKDYTLACCSYLRKIMHRLTFLIVLFILAFIIGALAFLGGALTGELVNRLMEVLL